MTRRPTLALLALVLVPAVAWARDRGHARGRDDVGRRHAERDRWDRDRRQHGGDWVLLGEKTAGHDTDHDKFAVDDEARYSAIRLDVDLADVRITRLKVRYANGDADELRVRRSIRDGGTSGAIDLQGDERAVKEVAAWYTTRRGDDEKARVRLYGLRR